MLLDWNIRQMPVPEKYRVLTKEPTFIHNWEILAEAMLPEEEKGTFEWQHVLYRDLFDGFFKYLERINHFISIKLISQRDVASLRYWLEQISAPRFVESNERSIFLEFILRYDYSGVIDLMRRFDIPIQTRKFR